MQDPKERGVDGTEHRESLFPEDRANPVATRHCTTAEVMQSSNLSSESVRRPLVYRLVLWVVPEETLFPTTVAIPKAAILHF